MSEKGRFDDARNAIYETTGEQLVDLWQRYRRKAENEVFATEAEDDKFHVFDGIFTAAISDVSRMAQTLFNDLFTLALANQSLIDSNAERWATNEILSFLKGELGEPSPFDPSAFDVWFLDGHRASRQFQDWMYRAIQMRWDDEWLAPTWFDPGEGSSPECYFDAKYTSRLLAERYFDLWSAILEGLEWAGKRAKVEAASSTLSSADVVKTEEPLPLAEIETVFRHTDDFRWVSLRGDEFTLSLNQARVVEKLWEAQRKGIPALHQDSALEGLDIKSNRMRDVFKNSPAWNKLVVAGDGRGFFRLNL